MKITVADYDTINKNLKWVAKDDEYVKFCLHKSINTVVGMYTTIKIKEDKKYAKTEKE